MGRFHTFNSLPNPHRKAVELGNIDMVQIISEYTGLKTEENGRGAVVCKGVCPLCKEGEIMVAPEFITWGCSYCLRFGKITDFLGYVNNISPRDSIKILIKKYEL